MKTLLNTRLFNTLVASAAAVLLLLFLLSYSETGSPPQLSRDSHIDKRPDFYLVKTHSIQFDEQGMLDMIVMSDEIEHNPLNNSVSMREPRLTFYQDGIIEWTVSSQSGIVMEGGKQLDLEQRVVISSADQRTILKTPSLTMFPDKKIAKTDKPVTLLSEHGFTRSIGLNANLRNKKIHLLKQVRGQYDAVPQ